MSRPLETPREVSGPLLQGSASRGPAHHESLGHTASAGALGRAPGLTQRAAEGRLPWLQEGGHGAVILLQVSGSWQRHRHQ